MTPKLITIHCSADPNGSKKTGEDIKRYHMAPALPPDRDPSKMKKSELYKYGRGWSDIGYHGVIECNGDFYQGRPHDIPGAHVEGHNQGNLGLCLIGTDKFTLPQILALRWVLNTWKGMYNIEDDKIFAHYEWDTAKKQGKTCPNIPGNTLRIWYRTGDDSILEPYLIGSPFVV